MLKIGLTGGIGSGKSLVSRIIESIGHPVFYSDEVGRKLSESDLIIRNELTSLMGEATYVNGKLNKTYISQQIFANPEIKEKVNQIIHPRVRDAFNDFCDKNIDKNFVFNEAAILFETGGYKQFDKMILIIAPESLRIKRVIQRDGLSEIEVKARILNQWSDEMKAPLSDYIIDNDEVKPLIVQVEKVLMELVN